MDRRLRVLHVLDSMKLGGIQTLLRAVLSRLGEYGIDCDLAVLHGPGPFSESFVRTGFPPIHLAASRWDPRIPWKLRRLLRVKAPDIVHAHGVPSCTFSEWLRPQRLVEHVHQIRGCGGKVERIIERGLYRQCDLLLACSRAAGDSVSTPVETRVIYNGIDPARFRPPSAVERNEARERFGFAAKDLVLGMTGRITRNKGQHRVCEALLACRERHPQLRLLLAGSGTEEESLRAWCATHGLADQVRFAGFQLDVLPVLHTLDAFIMASEAEGLGLSLLEAMSTGLPCLVSNFPAAAEIVTHDEDALIFTRGNASNLIEAIGDCVESPHKRLEWGARAREVVLDRFTLDETVAQFATAYRSLN